MKKIVQKVMYIIVIVFSLLSITQTLTIAEAGDQQPPPPPLLPEITASPSLLSADGISTSIISVVSVDDQGNPRNNANVFFNINPDGMGNISTKLGYVDGKGWLNLTDSNGRATAKFTSGTNLGNVTIDVSVGDAHNNAIIKLVDMTPPKIVNPFASPNEILLEEPINADSEHVNTTLVVTVTDASGTASVTINLSSIGGDAMTIMNPVGGNVYSINTKATKNPGFKSLSLKATDIFGNSNRVNIWLRVARNGDVNSDDVIDVADAMWLANNIAGTPGFETIDELASDVNGDGVVDVADAMWLANNIAGTSGFENLY